MYTLVNDRVEFIISIEQIGDKQYARNITNIGGKPIHPFIIGHSHSKTEESLFNDYTQASILGIVISETSDALDFGRILANVSHSFPVRSEFRALWKQ